MKRRFFLLSAPALVAASSLMPVSSINVAPRYYGDGIGDDKPNLDWQLKQRGREITIINRPYFLPAGIVMKPTRDTIYDFNHAQLHFKDCLDLYAIDLKASLGQATIKNAHVIGHRPFGRAVIHIEGDQQLSHAFVEFI